MKRAKSSKGYRHNCHLCSFSSDSESKVKFHLETHVDGILYICDECPYMASTSRVLARHRKTHQLPPPPAPSTSTSHNFLLIEEVSNSPSSSAEESDEQDPLLIAPEFLEAQPELPEKPKLYKCIYCPYSNSARYVITRHERIHTGEKPYICAHCDYAAATSSGLNVHKRRHHPHGDIQRKKYKTKIKQTDQKNPRIHPVVPREINPPKIPTTEKSKNLEETHKVVEVGKEIFRCGYCPFTHHTKQRVLRHMPIHSGYKPLHCQFCKYQTHRTDCLKSHLKRHEFGRKISTKKAKVLKIESADPFEVATEEMEEDAVEMKYEIPSGKKKQKKKLGLTIKRPTRERFDDSEKPYKCNFCPYRSKRGYDVNKHERIHTG